MKYLQNLHTHSTYCDGNDTLEEMILTAIEKGFDSLGFSGHSNMFYCAEYGMTLEGTEQYKAEIKALKEKYKDKIDLFCGLELDMYSKVDLAGYDYIIGSVHYILKNGEYVDMDRPAERVKQIIDEYFEGDGMKYVKAYYESLAQLPDYADVDIVGHCDLLTKHCENVKLFDEESPEYKKIAIEAITALSEKIKLFEVNTGAISRGYRTTPYPAPFILKELKRLGCGIIISSDCHSRSSLDCHFKEAEELVKECGFKEIYVLKQNGFTPILL